IEREEMRLTDLVSGFVDPNAVEEEVVPAAQQAAAAEAASSNDNTVDDVSDDDDSSDDDEDDDSTPAVVDTGPDPEEARERFARIRKAHDSMVRSIEKNGPGKPAIKKHRKKLAGEFMELRLTSKAIDHLAAQVRLMV